MPSTWKEGIEKAMIAKYGKKKASILFNKYEKEFTEIYVEKFTIERAIDDIVYLEKVSEENQIELFFYSSERDEFLLHLRLYLWEKLIPLSDIFPIIDNLNLRAYNDQTHKFKIDENHFIWVCDFAVSYCKTNLKMDKISALFRDAFTAVYYGLAENDSFNKLVLTAGLEWREVTILRAYAKYLHQIHFRYTQDYILKSLFNNADITKMLIDLFKELHDPANKKTKQIKENEKAILAKLDLVTSLEEDRVIRRILNLIKATLRTNYFQLAEDKNPKDYLALKFKSEDIVGIPLPIPLYEIYVYSALFEGIHLRNTKVARGGIRWSERPEDYRTEILGLMKAQKVKNAVIVPSGAKGGFVLKRAPEIHIDLMAEVVRCYQLFISGLLDITDNIKDQKFIHPKQVVCHDDFDSYLVVAADKGTASYSDIANTLAKDYNYWLGDAFASGGSTGYDHKKIGITARGAWESIKRHFCELNIDPTKTSITVVGIGDMSGDVFGNGMIYSKRIKLVAAFDHRNIFIDPDPNPELSYKERVRLFNLPSSSWEDYNPKLISEGGGVFKRSAKKVLLSNPMKKLLKKRNKSLTPEELIKAILKAPVQLLYNGGIGTYVKASTESNLEVEDRVNDWCRVNGEDLHCKVVVEGGNLGFTQLGRIEYALKGGLINTDSIDNSAGVDCSDHEVNLKILLDSQVAQGKLTEKKRNELLASATEEVAHLVINDNFEQGLLISYAASRSHVNANLHADYLRDLEKHKIIDRLIDFLPDDKQLLERKTANIGLTRPELAILVAYSKIAVKNEILNSSLPEDSFLMNLVATAFPPSISSKYRAAMANHRLRRDIIATQLSNQLVNEMGSTFIFRMQRETGASVDEIVRAFVLATRIFRVNELKQLILSLEFKVAVNAQYEMLYYIRYLISIATRWFLHSEHLQEELETVINYFTTRILTLEKIVGSLMAGTTKQYLEGLTKQFSVLGLPAETAKLIATYRTMYSALNIIEVARKNKFDLIKTAQTYYAVGERFNLVWFRDLIGHDNRQGHWNTLSRLTIRDELDLAQCALTIEILKIDKEESDVEQLINKWMDKNQRTFARWSRLLEQIHTSNNIDYPMFFIAMQELINMVVREGKQ